MLKVWLDILTPKQVLFFAPLAEDLRAKGCEVLATSRKYREIAPLAELHGLGLTYVGERGGKDPIEQLLAATKRQEEIIPVVKDFHPDISASVASGVCARVSFGMGIRHIAVNDSPHSAVAARLSLPLSHHLFTPWVVPFEAWGEFGVKRRQITRYRALDPAAWLKRKSRKGWVPELAGRTITVRLEESYAPYMSGTSKDWNDQVLRAIADAFPDLSLVALCRYGDQLEHVKQAFGTKFIVPERVVDGRSLLETTDAFVGMGGTMNVDSALMGVPTVSMFQGTLFTERYLKSVGLLVKTQDTARMVNAIRGFFKDGFKSRFALRAKRILDRMEDPIPVISGFIGRSAAED